MSENFHCATCGSNLRDGICAKCTPYFTLVCSKCHKTFNCNGKKRGCSMPCNYAVGPCCSPSYNDDCWRDMPYYIDWKNGWYVSP